jgi:hypothetical protein
MGFDVMMRDTIWGTTSVDYTQLYRNDEFEERSVGLPTLNFQVVNDLGFLVMLSAA